VITPISLLKNPTKNKHLLKLFDFLKEKNFSEENLVKSPLRILPIGSSEKKLTLLKVLEETYAMLSKIY